MKTAVFLWKRRFFSQKGEYYDSTESARQGIVSSEMEIVAHKEGLTAEYVRDGISAGHIVIPKNVHREFTPEGIGKGLRTKVNANIGTSGVHGCVETELRKMDIAITAGTHSIMDLSTGCDLSHMRARILEKCPVMLGAVPRMRLRPILLLLVRKSRP